MINSQNVKMIDVRGYFRRILQINNSFIKLIFCLIKTLQARGIVLKGGLNMIFNNSNFKTLQSSLDALWIKQKVISNNIANYETPGFKASKVSFNDVLKKQINNGVINEISVLEIDVKKDMSLSNRLDGNNVDIEKEQLDMWETYAQYTYLSQNLSKQLKNMSYVINNTGK